MKAPRGFLASLMGVGCAATGVASSAACAGGSCLSCFGCAGAGLALLIAAAAARAAGAAGKGQTSGRIKPARREGGVHGMAQGSR